VSDVVYTDLHRHLDGSLRYETLVELAGAVGVTVPPLEALRFAAGMGLAAALERFAVTLSVLQQPAAVERVAREMCEDAAAEGVSALEIRFAPQLHRGGAMEEIVDAAISGAAGRAGILLCGLYGEPPALVEELARIGASRAGVVGLDLAGGPHASHSFALDDYAGAFAVARDAGLGRTVHAGEGRPAAEIRTAIEVLGAVRIGHGTTLLEDDAVVDLVLARGVTIEACPTSNVHTGVIGSVEEHPLRAWLARGVKCCLNADNTLLSATDAAQEHARMRLDESERARVIAHGHAARFQRA
jgi:adenosine deaminase